jgi:hypothetical protein
MSSGLYGVKVYDATSIVAVLATFAAISLLAAAVPVLRIARIDPATTLRDELNRSELNAGTFHEPKRSSEGTPGVGRGWLCPLIEAL